VARGRNKFRQCDLSRALKAAKQAGVPVRVEIEDGRMIITMVKDGGDTTPTDVDEVERWLNKHHAHQR
jgi:hypothetical protein